MENKFKLILLGIGIILASQSYANTLNYQVFNMTQTTLERMPVDVTCLNYRESGSYKIEPGQQYNFSLFPIGDDCAYPDGGLIPPLGTVKIQSSDGASCTLNLSGDVWSGNTQVASVKADNIVCSGYLESCNSKSGMDNCTPSAIVNTDGGTTLMYIYSKKLQ